MYVHGYRLDFKFSLFQNSNPVNNPLFSKHNCNLITYFSCNSWPIQLLPLYPNYKTLLNVFQLLPGLVSVFYDPCKTHMFSLWQTERSSLEHPYRCFFQDGCEKGVLEFCYQWRRVGLHKWVKSISTKDKDKSVCVPESRRTQVHKQELFVIGRNLRCIQKSTIIYRGCFNAVCIFIRVEQSRDSHPPKQPPWLGASTGREEGEGAINCMDAEFTIREVTGN